MTTKISTKQVGAIQAQVRAAVEEVLKAHGYKVGKNACRYSDFDLKFTIEAIKDNPEAVADRARMLFAFDFKEYGVDFGTVVTDRNKTRAFKVEGFTRGGKLEARDQKDGKIYTGKPEIFYLNGKPLESAMARQIAEMNAKNAAKNAAALKAALPNPD